jgi:hypothetical protein
MLFKELSYAAYGTVKISVTSIPIAVETIEATTQLVV